MTVDQLISEVLTSIRNHWYADRVREFKRDERALMKAILRYGHECHQRGWEFDATFIFTQLMALLLKIRTSGAEIQYLPIYLDGAVKRAIGGRSEELSAQAKAQRTTAKAATRLVAGLQQVEAIREPTATEICHTVFQALHKRRGRARSEVAPREGKLL